MKSYTEQNKVAWEYNAYDFWVSQTGTPLGEIINSVINSGFSLKSFEEYPAWTNKKLPGEFTLIAYRV